MVVNYTLYKGISCQEGQDTQGNHQTVKSSKFEQQELLRYQGFVIFMQFSTNNISSNTNRQTPSRVDAPGETLNLPLMNCSNFKIHSSDLEKK